MAKDLTPLAAMAEEEKTKLKEEKKRFKEEQKAQKKEARRRAAEIAKQEEALGEDGGNGLVTFFATLLIVILWLAIVVVVVKMDVGGFGSSVLTPILKDVPVINKILPSTSNKVETEDEEMIGGYASIEEAQEYIRQLEQDVERLQTASNAKDSEIESLKAEVLRLQEFEQRQGEFQRIKTEFYEEVASLDADGLLKYYESIDPTTLESITKQLMIQKQQSEEVQQFVETYATMKPKAVAKVFEEMDDLELVAEILEAMTVEQRAEILNVMDTEIAAKLVKIMRPNS